MKKIMVTLGALALAGSLVVAPTLSANAEELPVDVSVDSVVEEATPVVEEVPEVVEAVEETPVEAAVVAPAPVVSQRTAATPATKNVRWLTAYVGDVAPNASTPSIWNQTLYTEDVCGTGWIQDDKYKYATDAQISLVDGLVKKATLNLVNGVPEDSTVYISHVFVQQTACVEPPALCEVEGTTGNLNAAGDDVWWEIHFGRDAATQNEPALFNAESYGGWDEAAQVGYDDKPAKHMIAGNIYVHMPVNAGQTETWTFKDGTKVVFTVGTDTCNPTMTWTTIPFVEEPPVEEPPVVAEPPVVVPPADVTPFVSKLELPAALAFTGDSTSPSDGLPWGLGLLGAGAAMVIAAVKRKFA